MSQETANTNLIYDVKVSYHVMDIDAKGLPVEFKKADQKVTLWKLQRRNLEHSKLAINILEGRMSNIDLALQFVECTIVDDKIKEDVKGDAFAAIEIYTSKEAQEDLDRFFTSWEYLSVVPENQPSKKK